MFPELLLVTDETLNDSDKDVIDVPDGEVYEIVWLHAEFAATSTVGNRQLCLEIQDPGGDVVGRWYMAELITADESWLVAFSPGVANDVIETAVQKSAIVGLPAGLKLLPDYVVRIFDAGAVAVGADDMVVQGMVQRHQVG